MKLEPIPKDGTTLTRKAFWDKVAEVVNASQKKQGKNISVDVHDGYGSVINVPGSRSGSGGGGVCCISEECSVLSEEDCIAAFGTFLPGISSCDPNPCVLPTNLQMRCEEISCQNDKCGFVENPGFESDPPKYYLHFERHITCGESTCTLTKDWSPNYTDCSDSTCDFSEEYSEDCDTFSCPCDLPAPVPDGPTHSISCFDEGCIEQEECGGTEYGVITEEISVEFTDEALMDYVYGFLPAYEGVFGACVGEVAAAGFVKGDGKCHFRFYVQRFRFKFTFDPAVSPFTIHWRYAFTPQATDTSCDLVPGTTFYSGFSSELIGIGQTESSVYTVNEFDQDNTQTSVVDVSVTLP